LAAISNFVPRYEYSVHDIMLGTKKELGRGAFGEMCVYLQPAASLSIASLRFKAYINLLMSVS